VVPADTQQTDTYYIVAHFHYVLFGGSIFGLFAGIYYWFPKMFGRMLSDKLGKLQFWLMFVGFNMTFAPFHILGLQGMPRRIYTYPAHRGWDAWNAVSTVGSFVIGVSMLVFVYNVWVSRKGAKAGADPWDARTLEWSTPSPPPEYNFAEVPLITARDDLWHRKYAEDSSGRPVRREQAHAAAEADTEATVKAAVGENGAGTGEAGANGPGSNGSSNGEFDGEEGGPAAAGGDGHDGEQEGEHEPHIHMPSPSYWPVFASLGLPIICYGMIYRVWLVAILGGLWVLFGLYSWGLEPATAPEEPEVPQPGTELEHVGGGSS
jgi:cytochrome c oxidase subunit 1